MGMRHYLNQLKLSLVRVRNAKLAKEEAKKRATEASEETTANPDEVKPA